MTTIMDKARRVIQSPTDLTDQHGSFLFKQKYGINDAYKNN